MLWCLANFWHVVTCGSCFEYHIRLIFKSILINVKVLQCGLKLEMVEAIEGLIKELDVQFPKNLVLDAMGVVLSTILATRCCG